MGIARFSVNRPVAVTMRILALVLLGLVCVTRLPVDLLPAVSIPTVAVVTQWPNVSPEEVEAQVTRPIEEAVSATPNVYSVQSSSVEGVSTVRIQLNWGADIGQGAVDVLQLVERARQRFPTDPTLQAPVVFKYDPSQLPIMIIGVTGITDAVKLYTLLSNEVSPIVESANGVASAVVSGGQQRAILVDVDPDRLRAHNLALSDIVRRLGQENLNLPAGIGHESNTEYTIRALGWFTSPQQIAQIPLTNFNGQIVSVGDVATVKDAHPETRLYTRLNSEPAVGLIISKQSGANTVATAKGVLEKLKQVQQLYPDLQFQVAYDQSKFIGNSVNDVKMNAVLGGTLALLIILFFLRNIRSTLVVALSIPTSIISTFALMYMCGFTINTMSLGGLALATGLIVDDAVVVLENIFRHIERDGKSPREAAISGASEIMSAVLASTFTVMIVFLPLMLIKGQSGQMFTQFALVVIFSIGVSLLDATTVVPMLASRLIKPEVHEEIGEHGSEGQHDSHRRKQNFLQRLFDRFGQWFDSMDNSYRNGLQWALRHRWWVILGALGITALSLLLVPQIGTELMPQTDSGDLNVSIKLPPGTALEKTNGVIKQVEKIVLGEPAVQTAFSAAGSNLSLRGTTTALTSYIGALTVHLKENRKQSTQEVMADIRKKCSGIPGARIFVNQQDIVTMLLTGGNTNLEVDIFGDDLGTLYQIGQQVLGQVRTIPGLQNVDVNWQESAPEIQWTLDRQKALQMGVTFSDMANTLNTASNGTIATYYQEKGFQYQVLVELPEQQRKTVADLMNLYITPSLGNNGSNSNSTGSQSGSSSSGQSGTSASPGGSSRAVLLQQIARASYGLGPSEITRQDRQRYIAVTGQAQGRSEGDVQADIQKVLDKVHLPEGYHSAWGLNQKRRAEEFGGMGLAIVLAIGLIYILLASQFESFVYPLTVLTSVPLSAVGVILALFLTGRSFGLTAMIGLLMLVGIVVKNGILLVDYINILRKRGMSRAEAILTAGPTRLRPILMTAFAAILGMLPVAIGIGKGSETNEPMATAVVGGLMTSTFLTIFVVPVVYTFFDDLGHLFQKRKDARRTAAAPTIEDHPSINGGNALLADRAPARLYEPSGPESHSSTQDQVDGDLRTAGGGPGSDPHPRPTNGPVDGSGERLNGGSPGGPHRSPGGDSPDDLRRGP